MLFSGPLREIEFQQIEDFCHIWPEGIRVEYKRVLVGDHIPKVISSFANTSGGVWIIGVATDDANRPIFPVRGFPREAGIEERITQTCYQNLYPPLLPEVKVLNVPQEQQNVVVVVQVLESVEAPHAIENSTKVYIRTNSTTEIIQLTEIDRIEYLLKRRQQPEQKRKEMIDDMASRSSIPSPYIRIVTAPRWPWRPILGEEVLISRIGGYARSGTYEDLPHTPRLVRQGVMSARSVIPDRAGYHVEASLYGVVSCYVTLGVDERNLVYFNQIVLEIGMAMDLARHLLKGTTTNFLSMVELAGARHTRMVAQNRTGLPEAIEDRIHAEKVFILEELDDDLLFQDHVAELVRQLMWSYNWADRQNIMQSTREILTRHQLP